MIRHRRRPFLAIPVLATIALSACAVGNPKPTTYITDRSATLNGTVASSVVGDTEYWWNYGETADYGEVTPRRTIAISDDKQHPVSEPIAGLAPDTTYHFQMCVQDSEEDPPRTVCSEDSTFATGPAGGRSGIAFTRDWQIAAMDADGGNVTVFTGYPPFRTDPAWSPDARRITFTNHQSQNREVFVMNADGSGQTNLTNNPARDQNVGWLPDGSKIVFYSSRDNPGYYAMNPDGSNPARLNSIPADAGSPAWSPDGSRIAFQLADEQIYVMHADGSNQTRLTQGSGYRYHTPAWSPDGRKIAYISEETETGFGFSEIFVIAADGGNPTNLTNTYQSLHHYPTWSPDGSRIAFYTYRGGTPSYHNDIFVMNADGSNQTPLTNNQYLNDDDPVWSPRP